MDNRRVTIQHCKLPFLLLSLLLANSTYLFGTEPLAENRYTGSIQTASTSYALHEAIKNMADGQFDQAQQTFSELPALDNAMFQDAQNILTSYAELNASQKIAHEEAYDKIIDDIKDAIKKANWSDYMLATSQAYSDYSGETKTEYENKTDEEIDKQWVVALSKLSLAKSIAEIMDLDREIEQNLYNQIIEKSISLADEYEAKEDLSKAFYHVYYYLNAIEKDNNDFQDHYDSLSRQLSLENTYVVDPNQETVSWQEKRANIGMHMIKKGLDKLSQRYVDPIDYKKMILAGVEYAYYLATTKQLSKTFEQLDNTEVKDLYVKSLNVIRDDINLKQPEQFNHTRVFDYLRRILIINDNSLKLPSNVVIAEYMDGVFSELDGHSYIIWPSDIAEFDKDMTQEFIGVGIEISMVKNLLTVSSLLDNSPAMRAGVDAGDIITKIDGKSTKNITTRMAVKRIMGPKGTNVVLTVKREGLTEEKDITITRDKIIVQQVKGLYRNQDGEWEYYLDKEKGIGYVQIKGFVAETAGSFKSIVNRLYRNKLNGLVVDLRQNSGGYLRSAIQIVDFFIPAGKIVGTRYKNGAHESWEYAQPLGTFDTTVPLVVLVDEFSASASEIVSGALKDHNRATIVGTRTYGKGNVQEIIMLYPAKMKMTIAYYYLPSNRKVHRNIKDKNHKDYGVEPDIKVELTSKQIGKRYEVKRNATILRLNDNRSSEDVKTITSQELIDSDPQLQMAILSLKADMLAQKIDQSMPGEYVKK